MGSSKEALPLVLGRGGFGFLSRIVFGDKKIKLSHIGGLIILF